MARKPKTQLHPDVAAALPVALAAMDGLPGLPGLARRGRQADASSPELPVPGRDDTGLSGVGTDAGGATPAKTPRRPKRPAAATVSAPEDNAPKRRRPQPDEAPELIETNSPGHEAGPSGDAQPSLPNLDAPPPVQPAVRWDRATDAMRFDWPAIERMAAADGPNQGMAKLLVAARAEGAESRWPL